MCCIILFYFFSQKIERSDGNDILGTYFRPRRAAELIHQNKVLNCWKDYTKKSNRTLNNWMTPSALANNLNGSANVPWQPIPASAALHSIRNGNATTIKNAKQKTLDEIRNKPFYGVRPTQNVHLNNNNLMNTNANSLLNAPNPNQILFDSLNFSNYFNEAGGDRMLQTLRRPIAPVPLLRDEMH